MLIYIFVIIITCFSCFLVQRFNKNKILVTIFSFVSILVPSYIGGMRDFTIGVDVLVYGKRVFTIATYYSNFINYCNYVNSSTGYLLLNFIVSRFTTSVNVFLFVHQLIINTLIYFILYKNRNKAPLWLTMLTFLCIYHFRSYNFLKQATALAFVFYGFKYLYSKNIIKYFICVFIAGLFHSSAYIAFLFYFINYIMTHKNKKVQIVCTFLIVYISLFVTLFTVDFMNILNNLNLISERYYRYTAKYLQADTKFYYKETIFRMIFILWYILNMKKINELDEQNKFLGLMIILDCIFLQFRNTLQYADRIAYYFGYSHILLIPQFANIYKNEKQKFAINLAISIILIVYFYYEFVIYKSGGIYPYTSTILGI